MQHQAVSREEFAALYEKHKGNIYAIAQELNVDMSSTRKRAQRMGIRDAKQRQKYAQAINAKRILITTAVSGVKADKQALAACETWARETGGQIVVIPINYRNPTSPMENCEDWFDPILVKYLHNQRERLAKNLILYADILQQPTKSQPLAGKQFYGGSASGIIPHTTQRFETVPVSLDNHAKWLATTGAITKPEYSESSAGAQGKEMHTMGALIVELDGPMFHARHVGFCRDGSFQDLGIRYTKTSTESRRVALMKLGDLHGVNVDKTALKSTMAMIGELQPRHVVLEDVLDFQACSHHADFFRAHSLHKRGQWCVETELHETCKLIESIAAGTPDDCAIIITAANHNGHLKRWLENPKAAHDLINAEIYHRLKTAVLTGYDNPLEAFYSWHYANDKVRFLRHGEGYVINGIESGYHGDKGAGGARGSAAGYAKIGAKTNIGHSHSPKRIGGTLQAGTLSKMMDYAADSPAGWLASNIVQYECGKRTLVNIIKGKYRLRK